MRRSVLTMTALVGVLVSAGCDIAGPNDRTRLSIYLTDAPGDVESVWIQIDEIFMIGEEMGDVEVPGELDELVEVTELVDRLHELAADVPFEPDTFRELRLVLGSAVLLTEQGEVFATPGAELPDELEDEDVQTLHCPSCAQSGLKIKVQGPLPELEEGESASLVLDFDVSQSFGHRAGNSGRWIMHPVVHATWVEAPEPDPTAILGTVAIQLNAQGAPTFTVPQCPAGTNRSITDFIPKATAVTLRDAANNPIVRTGIVAANGTFSISPVDADSYAMSFDEILLGTMKLVWTATVAPVSVTVAAGGPDVTGVAYTLTGASCVANP